MIRQLPPKGAHITASQEPLLDVEVTDYRTTDEVLPASLRLII